MVTRTGTMVDMASTRIIAMGSMVEVASSMGVAKDSLIKGEGLVDSILVELPRMQEVINFTVADRQGEGGLDNQALEEDILDRLPL